MSLIDIQKCENYLKSNKVTERRKYCLELSSLLDNRALVKRIGNVKAWNELIGSLQICLEKDACKLMEDADKKNTSAASAKSIAADLLIHVVDLAIKEDIEIKISGLLGYILGCIQDVKMKYYEKELLVILQKSILCNPKSRGKLHQEHWEETYNLLKSLIEKGPEYSLVSNCFMLLIKWGPTSGLSPKILREEFEFMTNFCQRVNPNSPRFLQEDTLQVAVSFCEHTAKDNRISCCKFGEDVILSLAQLHEPNGKPEKTKELLVEFFLLQMIIHHPNGVSEGYDAAYAHNWTIWKKILRTMFSVLNTEINLYFKCNQKNSSFFKDTRGKIELCENFSKLFVEISRQLFVYPDMEVTLTVNYLSLPQKRKRDEFVFRTYIEHIEHSKSWLWVHLVTLMIKTFPTLIGIDDYVFLLQVLSSIQIESNEKNVIEHLYNCFSTMLNTEKSLNINSHRDEIKRLWKLIGANTARAFGLNQHKEVTEKLLEQLISRGIMDFEDLLQTYQSGLISLSLQTIKTFNSGLRFLVLNDLKKKESIMRCILPSQNFKDCKDYKYLFGKETARLLVKLTFKEYMCDSEEEDNKINFKYDNLVEIYLKTLLDKKPLLKDVNENLETSSNTPDIDRESAVLLSEVVEEFVNNGTEVEENLFSKMILLVNICSCLNEYNIISEIYIKNSQFIHLIQSILNKPDIRQFSMCTLEKEKGIKRLIECMNILNVLFSLDVSKWTMDTFKDLIPIEFIRKIFIVLSNLQDDQKSKIPLLFTLKVSIIQALSNFACICGNKLNKSQEYVLDILAKPNYNCNLEDDYILITTFLTTLKLTKPGIIPNSILHNALLCIQELAAARYHDSAEDILNILCGVYPHMAAAESYENKSLSVYFLKPFYDQIQNNGPTVSILLLESIQVLCKLDPQNEFSLWSDVEVIKFVPEFLKSDYQEVRFKAIDVLVTYFEANSTSNSIQNIHRQEELLMKIYEMSLAVFEVSGKMTDERRTDEVLCRAASVLLTFVFIINSCDNWIEDSLYYLIKVASIRGLEQVDQAFKIINKQKFGKDSNILEKYIICLIEKWLNEGFKFENFQYGLFNYTSKNEFYRKNFEECTYFLFMREEDDVVTLAQKLQMTEKEIIEKTAAKMLSRIICSDIENSNADILTKNKFLVQYCNIVGSTELKDILREKLDQLVIGILNFLTDEEYIQQNLGQSVIFFTKYLNVSEVGHCFKIIEALLFDNQPLGLLLTDVRLPTFENILLQLKLNFYNSIVAKDQLKCFHRYTYFIGLITTLLNPECHWKYFFIRDVVYTLLNVIENRSNFDDIVSASCIFLKWFLEKIVPTLSTTFKDFLHDTVNSLKKFYFTRQIIATHCTQILEFLLIKHEQKFSEEIKKLDRFPDVKDFDEIRSVQKNIRYGSREPQLEDEIIQFLNNQDMMTKEDSLVNLRNVLASQKDKLLEMYERLQNIRGFSEDCENSNLHILVCVLSQLSYSTNKKVSFEAARCLGELGPANLQTLVLQPEKILVHEKQPSFDILLGTTISLLNKYIIDCDTNVIQATSQLLYNVFNSKEGRAIVDSSDALSYGPINKYYLIPYIPSTYSSPQLHLLDLKLFLTLFKDDNIWCPDSNISHNSWITTLVSKLLETFKDQNFFGKFIRLCEIKLDFCERILPIIIDLLISKNGIKIVTLISERINYFFSKHWTLTQEASEIHSIAVDKKSVKSVLNIVNYVKLMEKCNSSKSNLELRVDYLKVAKAAEYCANHFSALYYSELWLQQMIGKIENEEISHCEKRSTMIDQIYEYVGQESGEAETLHNILRNAYKSIGDFDALPGCGTSFLLQPRYRVEHYKELGKFDQVIKFYANQAFESGASSKELIDSFKNFSLYQIPIFCSQLEEPEYECLWRLNQWSFEEKKINTTITKKLNYEDYEKYRFSSLKALHNKNQSMFEEFSKCQFLCITNHLKNISLESSHNLYPLLTKLQSLIEAEDFSNLSKLQNFNPLFEKWKLQDTLIRKNDFQYVEPIIAQRLVLLTDYLKMNNDQDILRNYIIELSLSFAGWAKDEGFCKEGFTILENLKRISCLNDDTTNKIELLDAQLSWSIGNTIVAMQILNRLCKNNTNINPTLHSLALKLTGQYMSETHSENRTTIISDYFLASVKLMVDVDRTEEDTRNVIDTYDKLALFADKEYQQIMTYMNSDLFQKKIANMKQSKKTAASIQKQKNRTTDEKRAAVIHDKNSNIDDAEIRTARQDSNQFLKLALKYYLLYLTHSDDKNIRIFRVIALFLENRKNEEIIGTIQDHLPKISSYKFILALPQLIPHISDDQPDLFALKVKEIIKKCALEHPHHTLPLLLSLANSYRDREFDDSKTKTKNNDGRVLTAKCLIAQLKKEGLANLINRLDQMSQALIDLAYYKSPDENNDRKKEFKIPIQQKIMNIRSFTDVLVPTFELPLNASGSYSNIVGVHSFKSTYAPVGGVNRPKKILCRGTDGILYSQLVKGYDDLRQDAVMQQVFSIMNNLLSYNKSTKHLRIRTYKIVPLSMRSGILKWADNSMPIGGYLTGDKLTPGAHQIYRPCDKLPNTCREMFKRCANTIADVKLKTYKDICKKFKPVFHHFFEHYFPQPAVWYERRRAYIHSVATTSMCGYILGIGDRHTSNILIDKMTAEVIHIDFGIAFEQGRVLPTPETVPFRLSRDIVDGMGASGVEGIFRSSCEKTMEVLRQNAQTILTILEVLLYDPLYSWTVTSAEANKRQTDSNNAVETDSNNSSDEPTNVTAQRALLRLQEKLQGRELGIPRNIEHQVGILIQQAVDPENLCKLYVGWQPYV